MAKLNKGDVCFTSYPKIIGIYEGKSNKGYLIKSGKNNLTIISKEEPKLYKKLKRTK